MKDEQKIYACMDLTSLNDDDTPETIAALCQKAATQAHHVAAVCVYPRFVASLHQMQPQRLFKIATVANFPYGTETLEAVKASIQQSLADGADEIDVVLPYHHYLNNHAEAAFQFVEACKAVCSYHPLKVILETGVLQDTRLIEQASQDALQAGADFIKTSTGKTAIGATLEAAKIMLSVIQTLTPVLKRPLGFKASGGIRTVAQAVSYIHLAEQIRGEAVTPQTFRIGASQLVDALLREGL